MMPLLRQAHQDTTPISAMLRQENLDRLTQKASLLCDRREWARLLRQSITSSHHPLSSKAGYHEEHPCNEPVRAPVTLCEAMCREVFNRLTEYSSLLLDHGDYLIHSQAREEILRSIPIAAGPAAALPAAPFLQTSQPKVGSDLACSLSGV